MKSKFKCGNIEERIRDTFGGESGYETNVFVMMRYRDEKNYKAIEDSIRTAIKSNGLNPYMAKDRSFVSQLWENIKIYMDNCKYGIAVFEDIDEREFNPNVSIELGYMFGKSKECLILKEKRMPKLPTDICGYIYKDFDIFDVELSITRQIGNWVINDLGLSPFLTELKKKICRIWNDSRPKADNLRKIILLLSASKDEGFNNSKIKETCKIPSHEQTNVLLLELSDNNLIEYFEDNYYLVKEVSENLTTWIKNNFN